MSDTTGMAPNGVPIARSIPLRGLQRTVAQRMLEGSQTTASVTALAAVEGEALQRLLARQRVRLPELTLTPLLVKAVALCLRRHPRLNATLVDDTIHELAEINVAVALALPSDDLSVAILRRADEQPLAALAADLQARRERALAGKLTLADVRGATFTISNYGMLRHVLWATPILTPGQVAVLGVARLAPHLVPDGAGFAVRPVLPLSLTYDHRVVNGVPAGRFLDDLAEMLGSDDWLDAEGTATEGPLEEGAPK